MKTNVILMAAVVCAATADAGGWRFSVGPAWRSEVKMETRGALNVPTVAPSHTPDEANPKEYDRNPAVDGWSPSDAVVKPDPSPFATDGDTLYAIGGTYTETVVTPNGGVAAMDATDTRSPFGLKAKLGYDFVENETLSVGLDLRFAGYWNLRTSGSGLAGGATRKSRSVTDWWYFSMGPVPDDEPLDETWVIDDAPLTSEEGAWQTLTPIAGHAVRSRLTADFYQIGLGPTVTWHAFSWLDAYAGVAALANIAALDFEAGASKASETQCRFGIAGEVGLAAYVTENLGLYAEVGYEWVDNFDASAGGLSADVDFSSLVVSAGLAFRF